MPTENNSDYRNTEFCPKLENVKEKKEKLLNKIQAEHPRTKIIYNKIKEKSEPYKKEFIDIFNSKCAYCGIYGEIIGFSNFEVDHYVCESSFPKTTEGKSEAGRISNLVISCKNCNRQKKDFLIKGDYIGLMCPEDNSIANVFYRDEQYYIQVRENYKSDKVINAFYDKLGLGSEYKRLDYLLMELKVMSSNECNSSSQIDYKLKECFRRLLMKRNRTVNY